METSDPTGTKACDVKKLLTEEQIHQGVERLAGELSQQYQGAPLTVIGILTGSVTLVADLIRKLDLPIRVAFVQASSYRGEATTRGQLKVNFDMLPDIRGRHILLVDDIFDTGHTLKEVITQLKQLEPQSVRSAVLLRKKERQEVNLQPDYIVFDIPNEFVVGYGLDYNDQYRHLPYLAALEEDDLNA